MKNNFFIKIILLLLLIQIGFLVYQYNEVNVKKKYIQSRSNELKKENDIWLNFVTNSLFFLTEKDSVRKEELLYALSELDFKEVSSHPNIIELYHYHNHINPQILNLGSLHTKRNIGFCGISSYHVYKDLYSQQYFVGNDTYHFRSFESHNYEKYGLMINGKKLTWNNKHSYVIPKTDSLNITLTRQFLDFETGKLENDTESRKILL